MACLHWNCYKERKPPPKNERHIREGFVHASRKTSELRSHRLLTRAAYDEIRGERAIYANLRWVQPGRGGEEALSDAICSNNSVNTRAAGLGPLATLAHFSEVTQGKVGEEGGRRLGETEGGREGEIDFICFLSSSKCLTTTAFPPQINNSPPPLLLTSPLYWGVETTDFLPASSVCFSKRWYMSVHRFQHVVHYQNPQSNILNPLVVSFVLFFFKSCPH